MFGSVSWKNHADNGDDIKKAYAYGMGRFPDGVYRAEFPYLYRKLEGIPETEAISYYIKSIEQVFEQASPAEFVAAIVVEPLQGEGGFVPAPIEWVKAVRKICDKYGILLVADEVQSGFCRTGRMFASDYWKDADAQPDIVTTAKSIAGGIPLSAITAREEIMLYRSYTEFFARAQFIKDFLSRIRYNFSKPGSVSDSKMLRIPLIFGITFLFIL
ncbi:MAG: aminotransferase class III-fold pyridoxal phosphate-dependent enzyme [Lachnospiraceae bacterium]